MVKIHAWGRLDVPDHDLRPLVSIEQAVQEIKAGAQNPRLAYGMGRSYGDSCLTPGGTLWLTRGLDHFIAFDDVSGILTCEAGVLLRDIQRFMVPRGWMLPVTPGTQMVTVGGAIANDIHGKNHHRYGTFGHHVLSLSLMRTDGQRITCTPSKEEEWFAATIGGLGLTGVILDAQIQLRKVQGPWLETQTIPYTSLHEFFSLSDESEAEWEHTVSWIDCLSKGRGLFMRANPSAATHPRTQKSRPIVMPVTPPVSLVNALSLRLFNMAYFHLKKSQTGISLAHYEPFFYPLDNIQEWNRMYGPRGFYQYQCVVPRASGRDAVQAMLDAISKAGEGSFLAVLKTFGEKPSLGMLSFAQPGVTLALDFPNRGAQSLALFDRLDNIVKEARGRIYPAKDARMPREMFEAGYPRFADFMNYRDPGISSGLSRRLMGF